MWKEVWKWQQGITSHRLEEGNWGKNHVAVHSWEWERYKRWRMSAEDLRDHVVTDGSLLGVRGVWDAYGRPVVQLDHEEEMGPVRWMYGTLDAELEVQRTIKRAELIAFLCLLRKAIGPTMVHVDN